MSPEMMKKDSTNWEVIHISTGHEGGAGLAARRLNAALISTKVNSKFIALEHPNYFPATNERALKRNFWQKVLSGISSKIQMKLSSRVFFSMVSVNVLTIKKLLSFAETPRPIIHLHNWFNIVSQRQIVKFLKAGFPVVLTMHDQRVFTGGCHYSFECRKFESDCASCPLLPFGVNKFPKFVFRLANSFPNDANSNFQLIAPSKWMQIQSQKSKLVGRNKIHFVPNTLNFPPRQENKAISTESHSEVIKVGIASMNQNSYIKGGDLISELSSEISRLQLPILLVFLSDVEVQTNPEKLFWNIIDVLLVPSRADNSPNVIHEAKYYGIPVVATLTGGISELLHPEFDAGIPIDKLSVTSILQLLNPELIQRQATYLPMMISDFDVYIADSISGHLKIYNDLIL